MAKQAAEALLSLPFEALVSVQAHNVFNSSRCPSQPVGFTEQTSLKFCNTHVPCGQKTLSLSLYVYIYVYMYIYIMSVCSPSEKELMSKQHPVLLNQRYFY